jgi:hypothetical protein
MIMAQFKKNARERIRISFDDLKGHKICNIRVCFEKEPGTWLPGPKGIAFAENLLLELITALESAEEQSKETK